MSGETYYWLLFTAAMAYAAGFCTCLVVVTAIVKKKIKKEVTKAWLKL